MEKTVSSNDGVTNFAYFFIPTRNNVITRIFGYSALKKFEQAIAYLRQQQQTERRAGKKNTCWMCQTPAFGKVELASHENPQILRRHNYNCNLNTFKPEQLPQQLNLFGGVKP